MDDEMYLVNPITGSRCRLNGCKRSFRSSQMPNFKAAQIYSSESLPTSVDLRSGMTTVENQRLTNSCVANALAGAYEFLIKKRTGKHVDVSRLFIYYNARRKDDPDQRQLEDVGCSIPSAIEALKEYGCCKEEMYPFIEAKINEKPPEQCYSEAHKYRIVDGLDIDVNLSEMKACLAQNYPFAFCLATFQSFAEAETNGGRVPMPQPNEAQNAAHGFHAMLAVGYDDKLNCFIVRNSWGEHWGDRGYCYIPYSYLSDTTYCSDLHTIKTISNDRHSFVPPNIQYVDDPYQDTTHNSSDYIPEQEQGNLDYLNPWEYTTDLSSQTVASDVGNYYTDDIFWNQHDWQSTTPAAWKTDTTYSIGGSNASHNSNSGAYIERVPRRRALNVNSILWIDSQKPENANLVSRLQSDSYVHVDFCETFAKAEAYLTRRMNEIKDDSSKFQIICRGYYPEENKNPIDLLLFLEQYNIRHIPVTVYTQDEHGVRYHLGQKGSSLGINDWQYRLHITSNPMEVERKCKAYIASKSHSFA